MLIYDIIYTIFAICYLPIFLLRRKCHRGFLMRLGIFPQSVIDKLRGQKVIWLHTVSVGETQAASALVRDLKQSFADLRLVISTVTATGNRIAQELIDGGDLAIYSPLDISFVVKRAVRFINPKLFIIAETEIWPNLIINLAQRDVPVVLVNGRISTGSFRGYKIIRPFLKEILTKFSLFCMQTRADAQKMVALGAREDKVKVTGNMKFDLAASSVQRLASSNLNLAQNEQLFIAGSTHQGEEKIILQVYQDLIKTYPNLRLLIAPRHIERVPEIERLVGRFGFQTQRFSQLISVQRPTSPPTPALRRAGNVQRQILILDTIGQLKDLYALADIVFVGGSLVPRGGQNPIEPALFAKPILFGPQMFNFSNIAEIFLNNKAAIMVGDVQELKESCSRLLAKPELLKEMGQRAKELVENNRGATAKNMEFIKGFINSSW